MSVLVHAEVDGDRLDGRRGHPGVAAHPHRRRRDDPPRHQRRACTSCSPTPTSTRRLAADPANAPERGRGDAALGVADQEHGPHRHARRRARRASSCARARSSCCCTRRPTATRRCSTSRCASTSTRQPERARRVRVRRALLPRQQPGPARAAGDVRASCCAASPTSRLVDGSGAEPAYRPANFISRLRVDAGRFTPTKPEGVS